MDKSIIGVAVVGLLVIAGVFIVTRNSAAADTLTPAGPATLPPVQGPDGDSAGGVLSGVGSLLSGGARGASAILDSITARRAADARAELEKERLANEREDRLATRGNTTRSG